MITNEVYQDIQVLQNSDFTNVITFDDTHTMNSNMSYSAVIAKDKAHTAFTGPNKTSGTSGTQNNSDEWASASVNVVHFDLVADRSANNVTLTLPAEATQYFPDDFEGVWDLVEKDTSTGTVYIRQIQGDVVISAGASRLSDTFTVSVA
tara:strand:+ start:381 stop:827 length:447 start_codon:yes stop_codon:yes gene_type:complete